MRFRTSLSPLAALLAAAIAGGAVALGGAALVGLGDDTSVTTVAAASSGSGDPSASQFAQPTGKALSVGEIYRRSAPGVVRVDTRSVVQSSDFFGAPQQQEQRGQGSGFVIDKAGYIVTNYHVIAGASEVDVSFSNNEKVSARVVGRDPTSDVALLKVEASSRALTPLPLGDSAKVAVGDDVVAIGNPLGYERSITKGIVSAVGRYIRSPNPDFSIDSVIQTDAPINRGNSGGPLLNARGEVIGVNTQIATGSTSDGSIGIGFAVPMNTVTNAVGQLKRHGRVDHAFLGVASQQLNDEIARLFNLPVKRGLLIVEVYARTGAERAGLKAGTDETTVEGETWVVGGDIIVSADGKPVESIEALRAIVADKQPGDSIELEIRRGDETLTVDVELGRRPVTTAATNE